MLEEEPKTTNWRFVFMHRGGRRELQEEGTLLICWKLGIVNSKLIK
jgi:hypothetical protein